jgi:hypothetical protein
MWLATCQRIKHYNSHWYAICSDFIGYANGIRGVKIIEDGFAAPRGVGIEDNNCI